MKKSEVDKMFSRDDLDAISSAVKAAEHDTSGEIVPYIVGQSDAYDEASLRGALIGALLPASISLSINSLTTIWTTLNATELAIAVMIWSVLGWLAVLSFPPLKRFLAGRSLMEHRVAQRAREAFLSEELFRTKDRTGILIFVSLLEHHVIVMADSGISARVAEKEWQSIVDQIVGGIKTGHPKEALIEAITRCGTLLTQHGVAILPDDRNELPDTLRTGAQ